ncbi:MAG: hypothetical protein ABL894_13325 [Hyphomicrobium sp.]
MRATATTLALVLALATFSGTASAECFKVSGKGTGVTEGIAQFMANKALNDSIAKRGLQASGSQSMACDASMVVVTNCTAQQRACK